MKSKRTKKRKVNKYYLNRIWVGNLVLLQILNNSNFDKMKSIFFGLSTIVFLSLGLGGCVAEDFDPAGTCVTCMTSATPASTVVACANGDGTITLTIDGVEGVTSENDLSTFQVSQEGSGSSCQ